MAYSAGWDGADDPGGRAGARGPAGARGVSDAPDSTGGPDLSGAVADVAGLPGVRIPAAAGGAPRPGRTGGSTDSGGETTMSSVDFPVDLASPDAQAVARLLAAASAPPRPHELRGYDKARRAFERAGTTAVRPGAGLPLRRLIGVKVAAVAGVLTVTGVAVAAEADVLPTPIQRVAHHVLGGVGVPDPELDASPSAQGSSSSADSSPRPGTPNPTGASASGTAPGRSTGGGPVPGTPTGTGPGGTPGSSSSAPDADVLTMCRTYVAQQAGSGRPLTGRDRHRLEALAGGGDKIGDFCARTLAAAPADQTATTPSDTEGPPEPSEPSESTSPGGSQGSVVPSPSKDHKPAGSGAPPSSGGQGSSHGHTPDPSHTSHPNGSDLRR